MKTLDENTFKELLESKQYKALRQRLSDLETADISELLTSVSEDEAMTAFRLLPKGLAVDVFDHMDGALQNRLLESFSNQAARTVLEAMPPDDRAELLDEVPAMVARRLLQMLSPDQRQITLQLLGYEEGTAGREMNPLFVGLRSDMSIAQALERVRQLAINRETIYECYVMDPYRHLVGTVSLKDLVISALDAKVSDIMKPNPPFVFTHTDREEAARVLREHDVLAIPVVDKEQRLVGIMTHDDVADILEKEATEDIYRFGAVPGTERGYFTSGIFNVVRRRALWLFLLIMVNTVTASIIVGQEALLGEMVILASFIPLLIASGGNVGAQSATVIIRGLATGEVNPRRALAVVLREAGIGVTLGITLGLAVLGWAYLLGRDLHVAAIVSSTLVALSVMGALAGASIPFIFRTFKLDPALVSAPFITTVMDIFGVMLYFFVANLVLRL